MNSRNQETEITTGKDYEALYNEIELKYDYRFSSDALYVAILTNHFPKQFVEKMEIRYDEVENREMLDKLIEQEMLPEPTDEDYRDALLKYQMFYLTADIE